MNQQDPAKVLLDLSLEALQPVEITTGFTLLLKPDDYITKLLRRDGVFETAETDLVTRLVQPGDTCVDAGCHVGYYSCLLARLAGPKGKVYAFDANPECCLQTSRNLAANHLENAEVHQAALGDQGGSTTFYVSTEDQTGLSSLAPIPRHKEAIVVPRLRLQDFFKERRISRVRLLKLDVEGAEELILKGLGRFLADRRIDFILMECYDERLELMNTSAERIARLLREAGYKSWEYGTAHPSGWSITANVRSRGDVCYLFSHPSGSVGVPAISVTGACLRARDQRDAAVDELQTERMAWEEQRQAWEEQRRAERQAWQEDLAKAQQDIAWLWDGLHRREQAAARLRRENTQFEAALKAIEKSPGWRLLNSWRWFRDRFAPEGSWRRRLYEAGLNRFRGGR